MRFQVGKRSEEVHCIVLFLKERQKEGCPQEPNILSLIGWLSKLHWFQICQKKKPIQVIMDDNTCFACIEKVGKHMTQVPVSRPTYPDELSKYE